MRLASVTSPPQVLAAEVNVLALAELVQIGGLLPGVQLRNHFVPAKPGMFTVGHPRREGRMSTIGGSGEVPCGRLSSWRRKMRLAGPT